MDGHRLVFGTESQLGVESHSTVNYPLLLDVCQTPGLVPVDHHWGAGAHGVVGHGAGRGPASN